MQKLLFVACLALTACAVASAAPSVTDGCPESDPLDHTVHLPHPTNCTMFLRCDHGLAKEEQCPDNLHFNANLEVCDWPDSAGCEATELPA